MWTVTRLTVWAAMSVFLSGMLFCEGLHAQTRPPANTVSPPKPALTPQLESRCPADALSADVVAIDHPMVFNRIGAQNVNWMMYALRHDVIDLRSQYPLNYSKKGDELFQAAVLRNQSREIALRPDLRPRPLVLRVVAGGYLRVRFTNLLELKPTISADDDPANPFNSFPDPLPVVDHPMEHAAKDTIGILDDDRIFHINDQVASRTVGFHPQGLELVDSIGDDSSHVGQNGSSLVAPGQSREYCFLAPAEGAHLVTNEGAAFGGEGTAGNSGVGLFAAVTVQPAKARFYRGQLTEEEMRLATMTTTAGGQPVVNYEALYPDDCVNNGVWCQEGKAGLPILNMQMGGRIIHSDVNAIVVGSNKDGSFDPSTYPLEARGKRNPTVPTRLEPFREFVSIYHDENAATQAYPYFFEHPELGHTLHGVRDAFMINYGSGGIGSEIIANRLKAGPMQDCLDCAYEEFFLSSFAVGDAAMLVDNPVNLSTGRCQPEFLDPAKASSIDPTTGASFAKMRELTCVQPAEARATQSYYPHDPANVHHSYIGDQVKFRNIHTGKEQHIFHLHNHQWLFNPNDDNSNYIDAQGVGPGSGYTYEIAFGGSGNRNKTVGDAIFHCHFYPHFAQGMWYLWRNHDVMETGTHLQVSETRGGFHREPFALRNGRPAKGARALPDGEIVAGVPIPAVVPLPGKALPLMPQGVEVVPKSNGLGSKAVLTNTQLKPRNPGYPFWVAGVTEYGGAASTVGSRPTTPPLDMDAAAGGFDGGLPRHALSGYADQGKSKDTLDRLSAAKEVLEAKPIYFPETGTSLERIAMNFHATRNHATSKADMAGNVSAANFVLNGAKPVAGAPYNDPCIDDTGKLLLTGGNGQFFGGSSPTAMINATDSLPGGIEFGADKPRIYKGANIQLDVVFNKLGYHYPQQRILALWEDVAHTLAKKRAPEPLVLRMNTYDCAMYLHTNLVPKEFYADDYQITTPTDVIGQHIHLPKWDLTSADGSANGWNYEDGTFAPGAVRERIHAINAWNNAQAAAGQPIVPNPYNGTSAPLEPKPHPYFSTLTGLQRPDCPELWARYADSLEKFEHEFGFPRECDWLGARTTIQRWFSDPIVNTGGVHRGLGITFTHDHLGPSTHQQLGLYATMLTEPPGSRWYHNETGAPLATRADGGPTTWQAIIAGPADANGNPKPIDVDGDKGDDAHREFFLQFGDFQHAYQKGVYVGVSQAGKPYTIDPSAKATTETFRKAINPSLRKPASSGTAPTSVFPDIAEFPPECPGGPNAGKLPGAVYNASAAPLRPCPEGISADDVGMMVVNYRNEPVAARVYDPDALGPDNKYGMQGAGFGSDMAFALQTRTDRKCRPMNYADGNLPAGSSSGSLGNVCYFDGTPNTPYTKQKGALDGDPFTPILRAYSGDLVRVKVQAGSHEHEHNGSVNALAWLQAGSGFGQAPHSGWRNGQNTGLSEQFTFSARIADYNTRIHQNDRMYSLDTSQDGMWNGVWGVMRSHSRLLSSKGSLKPLPSNPIPTLLSPTPLPIQDQGAVPLNDCPVGAPVRYYKVSAVLANQVLDNPLGAYIDQGPIGTYVDHSGGTLVYNPRNTTIKIDIYNDDGKLERTDTFGTGALHDPTAILFVRSEDLIVDASRPWPGKLIAGRPLEPLVLRASAGECVRVVLENRLLRKPSAMPDLDGYSMLTPIIPRSEGKPGNSMTSFNNNLIRPSTHVGLHPQMVHYDVQSYDGNNVGVNRRSTVGPARTMTYQWYAGAVQTVGSAENCPKVSVAAAGLAERFKILNDVGGRPEMRPLSEVYDARAFEQVAASIIAPDAEPIAGAATRTATRTATTAAPRRAAPNPRASMVVIEDPAQKVLLEDLLAVANGAQCLESESVGVAAAAARIAAAEKEPLDEAPLVDSAAAVYNRNEVLANRTRCANTLPTQFLGAIEKYNRAPNKLAGTRALNAVTTAELLARSFQQDISGIDDAVDTAAAYRWLSQADYGPLDETNVRLVQLRPLAEVNPACRFVDVEYGGTNLSPPDRIKQGQKAAVGALVIEPWRARWREYFDDPTAAIDRQDPGPSQGNRRASRATADITYPAFDAGGVSRTQTMRDLVVVHQKGLNFRYGSKPDFDPNGSGAYRSNAVANIAAEREDANNPAWWETAPEDPHDSGHMAINYGSEPMWFRFGMPPDAPFGKEGFAGIDDAWQAFSNAIGSPSPGEPYVPIMIARAGQETRMRMLMPTGVGRATTFTVHGHVWPRDPYLAERQSADGLPLGSKPADWGIASRCIGSNPLQKYFGGQESLTPLAHFDIVLAKAGGTHAVAGDYLWRDIGGFGITSGLWGIMRVQDSSLAFGAPPTRCHP
jgi:manganese oxidase